MNTEEKEDQTTASVAKFELTILRASGIQRIARLYFPKTYVTVKIGDQLCTTKISGETGHPVWNETYTFAVQGNDQHVTISLYRLSPLRGKHVLMGSTIERLIDLEPRGEELTKEIRTRGKENVVAALMFSARGIGFSDRECRVFALVIAIDKYMRIPSLEGCVNDAKSFKAFLMEKLYVPDSQIVFLANKAASRRAILSQFEGHLTHNPKIKYGDTIIIFYAGHGSRVEAPKEWASIDGKIETICPHDEGTIGPDGQRIHGIPDRTINFLLHELATAKGNNITVIMDSCHSGGITRGHPFYAYQLTPRFVTTTVPIPETLDGTIWTRNMDRAGQSSIPAGFQHKFMSSHILLAACRQEQYAQEVRSPSGSKCGFFTSNLVKQLHQATLNKVTYSELLDSLPVLVNQNPQCEGDNKDRILFDGKVVSRDPKVFGLTPRAAGRFAVQAGSALGVVAGTEFIIEDLNPEPSSRRILGVLAAISVRADSSILAVRPKDNRFDVPPGARARLSAWKNDSLILKIFLEANPDRQLSNALFAKVDSKQQIQTDQTLDWSFVQVDSRSAANVVVSLHTGNGFVIDIKRLDSIFQLYADETVRLNLKKLENLPSMFDAIAHFNYHLTRHHGGSPLKQKVTVELYRLIGSFPDRAVDPDSGNLLIDHIAILPHDEDVKYGIAIVNHTHYNLFPYLFYFNPSTYSIDAWYTPPSSKMSPPLGQKLDPEHPTALTVGYGVGGGYAFEFFVPHESTQQSDTGFLKLFVSTKYVELDRIAQPSVMESDFAGRAGRREDITGFWDAWNATIIVHKP